MHDLLHAEPLAALRGARKANLAGVCERPPFVFGGGIVSNGGEIRLGIRPDVFKMAHEKTLPRDLGGIDVEISNIRLGNGRADFGPDIGVEFAVFLLLLRAEFDDGAILFHLRL